MMVRRWSMIGDWLIPPFLGEGFLIGLGWSGFSLGGSALSWGGEHFFCGVERFAWGLERLFMWMERFAAGGERFADRGERSFFGVERFTPDVEQNHLPISPDKHTLLNSSHILILFIIV